jgi:hypothetical protein
VYQTSEYLGELLFDEWPQKKKQKLISELEKQLLDSERETSGSGSKRGPFLKFFGTKSN